MLGFMAVFSQNFVSVWLSSTMTYAGNWMMLSISTLLLLRDIPGFLFSSGY